MQAGDVLLRQSFEAIAPFQGERSTWFVSVAQRVGIPKRRIKSLFYNPQCRLWGNEQALINKALKHAVQTQEIRMHDAINAHAAATQRRAEIDQIKEEIRGDILQDIRALLLELHGAGSRVGIQRRGERTRRD